MRVTLHVRCTQRYRLSRPRSAPPQPEPPTPCFTHPMLDRWNDTQAATCTSALALRAYASRLTGNEPQLVLFGGGNTSLKEAGVLYVKGTGADLGRVTERDFTPLDLAGLQAELAKADGSEHTHVVLRRHLARADAPKPSIETLMHAVIPGTYVDHTHAAAILAVANTANADRHLPAAFGADLIRVPYRHSGLELARATREAFAACDRPAAACTLVLEHHGACTWGESAKEAYQRMVAMANQAEGYLRSHGAWEVDLASEGGRLSGAALASTIASLRRRAIAAAGRPLIATLRDDGFMMAFSRREDLASLTQQGPSTPGHTIFTKRIPQLGQDVTAFALAYRSYLGNAAQVAGNEACVVDSAPRIILDAGLGMLALGVNKHYADAAATVFENDARVMARAQKLDAYATVGEEWMRKAELEYAGFEAKVRAAAAESGRVVLFENGLRHRQAIEARLAEGAAVVALDANPAITTLFRDPAYLGLVAGAPTASAVGSAAETIARTFGGLDDVITPSGDWSLSLLPLLKGNA